MSKLLRFGELRHRIYDKDDEPVRLWEEALSRLGSASTAVRRQVGTGESHIHQQIAQVYFDIAVQNFRGKCNPVYRIYISLMPRTANLETNDAVLELKQLALSVARLPIV